MATANIPSNSFVIIWVTTVICNAAYRLRGADIYLVSCCPEEMAEKREEFPHHQVICSDDEDAAWQTATEIAKRHRKPRRMSPTTYCQIGGVAA